MIEPSFILLNIVDNWLLVIVELFTGREYHWSGKKPG
jgi:hypothetical protein